MTRSFDYRRVHPGRRSLESIDPDLELISASLRAALVADPSEDTARRHLASMRAAATASRQVARAPERPVMRPSMHRRRHRARLVWVAGASSLALAFSGIAAAGALPRAAQHQAARVAAIIRIHIPDAPAKVTPPSQPAPKPTTTSAPTRSTTVAAPPTSTRTTHAPTTSSPAQRPTTPSHPVNGGGHGSNPSPPKAHPPTKNPPAKKPPPGHRNKPPGHPKKKRGHGKKPGRKKPVGKKPVGKKPSPPPFGGL